MQRLSTGKRINGAVDDAAGLQIANRLRAEISGLNQSVRNAADAHSMLAAAEGTMDEIHNILHRMRELAVQSANGTMDTADRNAVQSEFVALEAEINRINDNTTWAGLQLTDGTFSVAGQGRFQVGPDASQVITHRIEDLATTAMSCRRDNIATYTGAMSYNSD